MNEITTNKKRLNKNILNIIRTTLRNSMDLTQLSDNKANVLLSLSSIILTFLIPSVFAYIEMIKDYQLSVPLILLVITCLVTILMCAIALKPGKFDTYREKIETSRKSPFFFGNFYKMNVQEFEDFLHQGVVNEDSVNSHIAHDLFYYGKLLGLKMTWVDRAFIVFMIGMVVSLISSIVILILEG